MVRRPETVSIVGNWIRRAFNGSGCSSCASSSCSSLSCVYALSSVSALAFLLILPILSADCTLPDRRQAYGNSSRNSRNSIERKKTPAEKKPPTLFFPPILLPLLLLLPQMCLCSFSADNATGNWLESAFIALFVLFFLFSSSSSFLLITKQN